MNTFIIGVGQYFLTLVKIGFGRVPVEWGSPLAWGDRKPSVYCHVSCIPIHSTGVFVLLILYDVAEHYFFTKVLYFKSVNSDNSIFQFPRSRLARNKLMLPELILII